MPELNTETLAPNLVPQIRDQAYNGLDCCVTLEVFHFISKLPRVDPKTGVDQNISYNFARAMQAPALEMMFRGILTDRDEVADALRQLKKDLARVEWILEKLARAVWRKPLNPRSPAQVRAFFYETMGIPEQYSFKRGVKKVSTDRDALEKIALYFHAEPIVNCILKAKDLGKKISVLETEVDQDGRMRTSYNVVGTETGRWSSSQNAFLFGTNLQNITGELRKVFIPDPGWKLGYIDLSQAESRVLGWMIFILFGDSTYLDACEAGDLHTIVAKLVWPELEWSEKVGDNYMHEVLGQDGEGLSGEKLRGKYDRHVADQSFYRHFSYRDLSKRGGHATNYYGKPITVARALKVATGIISDFQSGYTERAFPGIPRYWRWVAEQVQTKKSITTILGRTRHFFGRTRDDATLREGIAFSPQSVVGELLNLALWRVWRWRREVQILAQVHDAILFQYRPAEELEVLPRVRELMATPLHHNGRTMIIPSDIEVGWNWAKFDKTKNPSGMLKWTGKLDERPRPTRSTAERLDRFLSRIH